MTFGLLIFYGIALTIILTGGLICFFGLKNTSFLLRVLSSLLVMSILVLIWPLPIHGGFKLLGEAIYKEWRKDRQQIIYQGATNRQQFSDKRFRGELPIQQLVQVAKNWVTVTYDGGQQAWLDTASGQVWSDWLLLQQTDSLPSLKIGKSRCSELMPTGFWSLPTEAEHIIMRRNGGMKILPGTKNATMAYIIDIDFKMEMPTYQLTGGNNNSNHKHRDFSVRCVARGPGGPDRGYLKQDIPLEEWNRYQMSKLNH